MKRKVAKHREWIFEFCLNSFKVYIQNTFPLKQKYYPILWFPLDLICHDWAARGPESNSKYSKAFGISTHTIRPHANNSMDN